MRKKLFCDFLSLPNVAVLEEVGIRHGSARIDFLVVNGLLHGFEVKSDLDTLRRLANQARNYNSALDRVTLIVGFRHADEAFRLIPEWWGVKLVAAGKRGGIHFHSARGPKNNPAVVPSAVVKFLWREEALQVLSELGADKGMHSKTRQAIHSKLIQCANLDFVRAKTRHYLRFRKGLGFAGRQKSDDD